MSTPTPTVQSSILLRMLLLATVAGAAASICVLRTRRRHEHKLDQHAVSRWADEGGATVPAQ